MDCHKCSGQTFVLYTRVNKDYVSRRRHCPNCSFRFSTEERISDKSLREDQSQKPREVKIPRKYDKEVFDFLFNIADSNGIAKSSLNEIASGINASKSCVNGAIRKLLENSSITLFKRPTSKEPSEFLVSEASFIPEGIGTFKNISNINPKKDAAKILDIAKELGSIELSIKDNHLVISIAGKIPSRSSYFGSYNEHAEIDHIIEDLQELIK